MSDLLDGFLAEESFKHPSGTPRPPSVGGVSLQQLELAGISLEWHEYVAIMRGCCEAAGSSGGGPGPSAVGPDDVVLDAKGGVRITASGAREGVITPKELAELFRTRLQEADAPTQLMLALALASLCATLKDFSKSIERFEQPDRASVIRGVYGRYASIGSTPTTPAVTPKPVHNAPTVSSRFRIKLPRQTPWIIGGIVVGILVVGVLTALMLRSAPTASSAAPDAQATPTAPDAQAAPPAPTLMQGIIKDAASAVETVLSRLPTIDGLTGQNDSDRPPPPSGNSIRLMPEPRRAAPARGALPTTDRVEQVSPVPEQPSAAPVAGSPAPPPLPADPRVYTAADLDVVPPVSIYPQFPTVRPAGAGSNDVAEFEVVVTESGQVQSAKARRAPASLSESMIVTAALSAAKTWRFHPALKDGVPVTYRKVIWVGTN